MRAFIHSTRPCVPLSLATTTQSSIQVSIPSVQHCTHTHRHQIIATLYCESVCRIELQITLIKCLMFFTCFHANTKPPPSIEDVYQMCSVCLCVCVCLRTCDENNKWTAWHSKDLISPRRWLCLSCTHRRTRARAHARTHSARHRRHEKGSEW